MADSDLSADDWRTLIGDAEPNLDSNPQAETFLKKWNTFSNPVAVRCSDGKEYVLKSSNTRGKAIVTDQIVGRLGNLISAPVPMVLIVDVPQELIDIEPKLSHFPPGPAHACHRVPDCTERKLFDHAKEDENRDRFASLAVLYGWTVASDHQMIYENDEPHLVWSVDHGHFFPGTYNWTPKSLKKATSAAPDQRVMNAAGLSITDLDEVLSRIKGVSAEHLASVIAAIPESWNITEAERIAAASFLYRRRKELLKLVN